MLEPKDITIATQDGTTRDYILSKFPAIQGREIISKYPLSGLPKLGDYGVNEETMLKLMAYVAVRVDSGAEIPLKTRDLVNNHVPDWETLVKIEKAMLEYNCSFFANGQALTFFGGLAQQASGLISKILTDLLAQSSRKAGPP